MPEYSCYYEDEKPFLTKRYIDDIKNLKVGDYLVSNRTFETGGMTKVYPITKITKHCVFIDQYRGGNEWKTIRLKWEDLEPEIQDSLLMKGYLSSSSFEDWSFLSQKTTFYYYVKQDEIDLTHFTRTDQLLRGCA